MFEGLKNKARLLKTEALPFIWRKRPKSSLTDLEECLIIALKRQTLAYLCVQPEEIKNVYENELNVPCPNYSLTTIIIIL